MKKPLKNYWFSRLIALIFVLCSGLKQTAAQNSFLIKIQTLGGYSPEVFEDKKGCIVAKYNHGITRINPDGRILWNTKDLNIVKGACIPDSQGYILPSLGSEMGGFCIQSFNYKGKKTWVKRDSISATTRLRSIRDFIIDSARKQYIVVGDRSLVGEIDNYWIAGLDYSGHIIWEKEWHDSIKGRRYYKILKNKKTGCYLLLSEEDIYGKRNEIFLVDTLGKILNRTSFEPNPCNLNSSFYRLTDIICFNDSMFLATIYTYLSAECKLEEGRYFYLYNSRGNLVKRLKNDWAVDGLKQTKNKNLLIGTGNFIGRLNKNFELEWVKEIIPLDENELIDIVSFTESEDGGYIGIAECNNIANEYYVYIFKTDSLGNINQKEEYSEKKQPFMLQPNPASGKVRLAIPYYYGHITAEFYDIHGVLLYSDTRNELEEFDISSLPAGMYIVKAQLLETGEQRTMKLVVQ